MLDGNEIEMVGGGGSAQVADPAPKPTRRSFTAEYRDRVVAEYEAAARGEKNAVLRREGLYQSQIAEWAAARDARALGRGYSRRAHRANTKAAGKGRAGTKTSRANSETARLRRENDRLKRELACERAVVDIMGKLQGLLERISESTDTDSRSSTR